MSSAEYVELAKILIPIAVGSVSLLVVARQIWQQNRLERTKIEVEYLRQVLEVLEVPLQTAERINSDVDQIVLDRAASLLQPVEVIRSVKRLELEWRQALHDHDRKVSVALAFSLEHERKELTDALQRAYASAHHIESLVAQGLKRVGMEPPTMGEHADSVAHAAVREAVAVQIYVSGKIVARITELFG